MKAIDLIKQLEPYQSELSQYTAFKSITDTKKINELVDIWDEFVNLHEVSGRIYGTTKRTPPTNRGCNSCVAYAVQQLITWKNLIETEVDYHYSYKGVPQAKVIEEKPVNDFDKIPFITLRQMAKKKGLVFTNKTKKAELIKLLSNG